MQDAKYRLTTDHAASSYGIPVIVDAHNQVLDYAPGLRQIRREQSWSVADMAEIAGVSPRTVEGWEQGRQPSTDALLRIMHSL